MGDSLLRGVFLHAVAFLSARSSNIEIVFNDSIVGDPHRSRYMCCSAHLLDSGSGDISQCELHALEQSLSPPLAQRVTSDILARRARGGTPICVSFTTSVYTDSFRETFAEFAAAFAATGIRPTSTVVNPGIWLLLPKFDLDGLAEQLEVLQAACATLFSKPPGGAPPRPPGGPGQPHTCILMTTADTAYTDADAAGHKHRRLHRNIQGYNTAMAATWLDGGMPVVDAGALSLHPAVANSIDGDKLHYGVVGHRTESSPANPFSPLCWQAILHTAAANGSHPCERGAARAREPTPAAGSAVRAPAQDHAGVLAGPSYRRVRGPAHTARRAAAFWTRLMDVKRQRASGGGWKAGPGPDDSEEGRV